MNREFTLKVPPGKTLTALLSRISQVAVSSSYREPTTTGSDQVSVTVIEPNFLDKDAMTIRPTKDPTDKVVEISSRPLQDAPSLKLQRHNKKKATALAGCVAKTEVVQKKKLSRRKNRFCEWCKIFCNSNKIFYYHNQS